MVLVGAGLLVAVASATGSSAGSGSGHAAPSSVVAGGAISGCGRAAPTGQHFMSFTDQGRWRWAAVFVPPGYVDRTPTPLVLNLHGSGSNGTTEEEYTGMDREAEAADFIAVYPTADIPDGPGFDWNVPGDPVPGMTRAPNDVLFLENLVTRLEHRYCVNQKEVFLTGFSRGARLTDVVACQASDVFAAVAPVSGVRLPTPCPTTRPVPLITIHGLLDDTDPYDGNGIHYWTYSVPTAVMRWAAHDGCAGKIVYPLPNQPVEVTSYACPTGVDVQLYTIADTGHEWPGGDNGLPPGTPVLDASAVIWSFFRSHPMK